MKTKTHSVSIRFSEAELARVVALPRHAADRSESDKIRRLLAMACDQVERQSKGAAIPEASAT